jgi:hypothetical protein
MRTHMRRYGHTFWMALVLLTAAGRQAQAFSLLGPSPAAGGATNPALAWQTAAGDPAQPRTPAFNIGYNHFGTDIGGPVNLGEEYRWNVPVITYAFDKSFLDYFGSNGVAAVEAAIKVFNDLPPVSQFSSNLVEFPLNTTRVNFRAQQLTLLDLKSVTMGALMEQLGLAEPERFAWTLRDRRIITVGGVDFTNYFVIQRNFDPVTLNPTPYVNNVLYNYIIREFAAGQRATVDHAEAIEVPVQDPSTLAFSSVAGRNVAFGNFFMGLTRDDVGGLRYLYRTNNVNVENFLPDVQVAVTNVDTTLFLTNFDLGTLLRDTIDTTNTPTVVSNRYPGLNITSISSSPTQVLVTNITTMFVDFPAQTVPTALSSFPTGIVARPVFVTNITPVIVTNFTYTYDNIVTNTNTTLVPRGPFTDNEFIHRFVQVSLSPNFSPSTGTLGVNPNTLVTNVAFFAGGVSNFPNAYVYIRPVNTLDFRFLAPQFTNVSTNTNTIVRTFGDLFAFTNETAMQALQTEDLSLLVERSRGTLLTPAQLLAIPGYTNLLITRTNIRVTNVMVTNFVNIGAGTLMVVTNAISNVFDYTFGNVVTTRFSTNALVRRQTVDVIPNPFVGPATNLFITNLVAAANVVTNGIVGEFYVVPTNLAGFNIVAPLFTNVGEATNFIFTNLSTTNPAAFTNTSGFSNVVTMDLGLFSEVVSSNSPAAVLGAIAAAFPNQPVPLITSTSSFFTVQVTAVVTNILTNDPVNPAVLPPIIVTITNFFTNVVQRWNYTFGNVITNPFPAATNGLLGEQTTTVTRNPLLPAISTNFITNVTTTLILSNFPNGFVYVVPTNLLNWSIVGTQLVTITNITNNISAVIVTNNGVPFTNRIDVLRFITNFFLSANPVEFINPTNVGFTGPGRREEVVRPITNTFYAVYPVQLIPIPPNLGGGIGTNEEIITFSTNVVIAANPVVFLPSTNQSASRRGVDRIQFQRASFDSLVGQNFTPITNDFATSLVVTNSTNSNQFLRRVVVRPDILFGAEDLGFFVGLGGPVAFRRTFTTGWDNNNAIDGNGNLAGPGVVRPPAGASIRLDFNKVGAVIGNQAPFFLDQSSPFFRYFVWGSFDGSTNTPVVYPAGTSILDLERQILTNAPAGP